VAVVWSSYVVETVVDGKRSLGSSRETEIFVRHNGQWTNSVASSILEKEPPPRTRWSA